MFAECLTLQFAGRLIIAAHPCVFVAVSRPLSAPQPALEPKMPARVPIVGLAVFVLIVIAPVPLFQWL